MNRNIGLSAGFLAVIVVFMRAFVPVAQVNSPAGAPTATAAKQAGANRKPVADVSPIKPPNPDNLEGPWLATRHFYGPISEPSLGNHFSKVDDLFDVDKVQGCAKKPVCGTQLAQFFGIGDRNQVRFLLATVPDPLHSRLSLFTDASIQAIEEAATRAGWRFATQWLPWNDNVDPDEKDPKVRRTERADIRGQEKQPGVMVFRAARDNQVLMVFLAGETPTAGTDSAQFQLALAYMDAIAKPAEVRIQGPTLSGSFASLTNLLLADKALNQGRTYRVRSGTVTSAGAGEAFQTKFPDFRGATANTDDQKRYFREALGDMGILPKNAALLVEDESSAGESAAQADPDIKVFRFPREISHLRNAYREAVQSSKTDKTPAPDLDFSLKDPTTGEDSIPIYSSTQSPLSLNGVVNEITSAIRRDGIRIVRVTATNVLDILFLAEVLKQRCPDTRLMVSFPDVLFIQAAQTGKLAGTLALSSYPMFYGSNQWTGQGQYPQFFSNANAEGVYNATLLLLWNGPSPPMIDYHWKQLAHPPTWVLTLDRQGFLPVNVLPHTPEDEKTETWFQTIPAAGADSPLKLAAPPGLWNFVSTAMALAGTLIALWILAVTFSPAWQVDARLSFRKIDGESAGRPFFLFLFLILLVSMLVVIWSPLRPPNHDFSFSLFLPGIAAGILLLIPALLLLCGGFGPERSGPAMLAGLLPAAGVLWLWLRSCSTGSDRGLFFAMRALEMRVGSSPAWPILAALGALLAWAFVHLTRFYIAAYQKPDVLIADIDTIIQPRLADSFRNFSASLESSTGLCKRWQWSWFAALVALGVLLGCAGRIDLKLQSIEGSSYDILVLGLQLLVTLLLLLACWHVLYLWSRFHSFLSCLGILPLANSFIRIERSVSDRPVWVRRLNFQSINIHARSLVALHDMDLLSVPGQPLGKWMQSYTDLLTHGLIQAEPQPDRGQLLKTARELRTLHTRIACELFKVAHDQWLQKPLSTGTLTGSPVAGAPVSTEGIATLPASQSGLDEYGELAQLFVALHYSSFILYGIQQIRYLVGFLSAGFLLLVFSMSSYNFQSPQFIGRFLLVLFAVITGVVWRCLSGMERDPVVSRIAGSDPGKLNTNFYLKLVSYGGLPLLGLLASLFPSIANFLLSSIEPALEALR